LGGYLITEHPVGPADAIVILGGGTPFRALEAARLYRQGLRNFLLEKYPVDPEHPYSQEASAKAVAVKVAFAEIPQFQDRLQGPAEAVYEAMFDGLLLALWVAVAFGAAYVSFLRCDVR
jgi:hypothetical protein